ncbi:MAG: TonB-dependent receptor [Bacteroidetes bacterium]|nr:TonB-dependent receptor [Bacteroidota bacterium]
MKRLLQLSFLSFLSSVLLANNGAIKGKIADETTGEPLPYVNVVLAGTNIGATTDINGTFIINDIEEGNYKIKASFIGYTEFESDIIEVKNGITSNANFYLSPGQTDLEEVVIRISNFERPEEVAHSMQKISIDEIRSNPGANGDISKVIQSFPGVSSGASFRNDIMVRGGGPAENIFYLDEIEVPTINHFQTQGASGGTNSMINSDQLASVDFYSGAFPADKPNALSSVFNFNLQNGNSIKPKFRFSVGASEVGLAVDGPAGKKSDYLFSIRRSYLQFLFSALELPFLPTFNDYQFKWRTRINERNEIKIISIGAYDQFRLNKGIDEPDPEQEYFLNFVPESNQWNYAIGGVYKHYGKNSFQTIVLSRNMLDYSSVKYQNNDISQARTFDYNSQEIENKLRLEHTEIFKTIQYTISLNTEYVQYHAKSYNPIFINGNVVEFNSSTKIDFFKWGGSFSFVQNLFNDRMKLVFGIRTDANNYTKKMSNAMNQISPRISARYNIQSNVTLTASLGRYFRLPSYTTLGHRDTEGFLVNKNEDIDYIKSDQAILGIEYQPTENVIFSVEGFFKKYNNYPVSLLDSVSLATKGGDFGVYGVGPVISNGEGRAFGVEILNRTKISNKLNITASYTFYRSQMKDKNGTFISTNWDNRHLVSITSTYNFNKSWSVGAKWRYAGGSPYTPYDLEFSAIKEAWDTQNEPFKDWSRVNSKRFKAFHQLDIRIDKRFFFKKWMVNLYLDIQNAYNFKSQEQDLILPEKDINGNNTLLENGSKYKLQSIPTSTGTIIPTFGIIIEF